MHPAPIIEPDRFFAAPRSHQRLAEDAQTSAIERMVLRCERLRPHLRTVDTLEAFVARQADPALIRRRIALAVALEQPEPESAPSFTGRSELEAFRKLALRRTAAVVWVFT